jgi:hypothetical protein
MINRLIERGLNVTPQRLAIIGDERVEEEKA